MQKQQSKVKNRNKVLANKISIKRQLNRHLKRRLWVNNKYMRSKRAIENFEKHKSKNIDLLKRFQWYFEQNKHVNDYLQRISQNNINKINSYLPSTNTIKYYGWQQKAFDLAEQLKLIFETTLKGKNKSISFLSPRIFSLFSNTKNRQKLLSPDLFGFGDNGDLPLPKLFQVPR
uniref:Uncharacterized protein n=1 Tax=Meloidogyne enterolobii TaxID=390850 RepID=A0A6V7W6U4_MELEN|nr:unnamed protein product [Meloidogyne enterolobii]